MYADTENPPALDVRPKIKDEDAPKDVRETRVRTLTEKGLAYQKEIKGKKRVDGFRQIMKLTEQMKIMTTEETTVYEMKLTFSHWLTMYEHFLDSYEDYTAFLSEEEKVQDQENWFIPKDEGPRTFKTLIENWFEKAEQQTFSERMMVAEKQLDHVRHLDQKDKLEDKGAVGHLSSRRSVKSNKTSLSSHSSVSHSIKSARLAEEQKKAELLIKAAALQKKNKLEQAKLRLSMDQEHLEIQEQIDISNARTKVLDNFEVDVRPNPIDLPPMQTTLNVDADTFRPRTETNHSNNPGERVSQGIIDDVQLGLEHDGHSIVSSLSHQMTEQAVMSVVRHLKKPPSDIKKFGGDPLEYRKFLRQFNTKIVNNTEDDDERMNYLEQYTVGEANKIVSGLSYLEASTGYPAALKELDERYGDAEIVVNAFIKKALNWPMIKAANAKGLDDYSMFLTECWNAVKSMQAIQILEYSENMRKLVNKLPYHLHDKWRSLVLQSKERKSSVKFSQLVDFVRKEAKKANDPTYGKDAMNLEQKEHDKKSSKQSSPRNKGSFALHVGENSNSAPASVAMKEITSDPSDSRIETSHSYSKSSSGSSSYDIGVASKKPCLFCNDNLHSLDRCTRLSSLPFSQRTEFLKTKGLCFGCLKIGHTAKYCRHRATCLKCMKRHPTILHYDVVPHDESSKTVSKQKENPHSGVSAVPSSQVNFVDQVECHTGAGDEQCTMAIIPVKVRIKNGMNVLYTYAFLDPGSNVSFCSDDIANQLSGGGKRIQIKMDTMGSTHKMYTQLIKGLEVSSLEGDEFFELPTVYTKQKMPVSRGHIPTSADINRWPHLEGITLPSIDCEVGLLIGNNVPDAYTPLTLKTGPRGSPHAAKTLLGWVIWNLVRQRTLEDITVNRAEVVAIQEAEEIHKLNQLYQKATNMDFPERTIDDVKELSQEDKKFLHKMRSSVQLIDGHYQVCLPFRDDHVQLPNNRDQALKRLQSLKKKMLRSPKFHNDYNEFMSGIITSGYAVHVPDTEIDKFKGKQWYLPHHGVCNPKTPDKFRVVLDCAAVHRGISLNNVLLQGPDMTNSLVGVLIRFRQENTALMGDIKSMFHQVRVPEEDSDCLRFLWWPDGDVSRNPEVYKMAVHLFGAISSPSCANFALLQTAKDNQHLFDDQIIKSLMNNFYVDDFLKSVDSDEKAVTILNDIRALCSKGGFHLTKWSSNSRSVLESVASEERSKSLRQLNLDCDQLPTQRALGLSWSVEEDTLDFKIDIQNPHPTRRSMLSLISSIYDPLGLVAPFVLPGKMLLQDLCRLSVDWDQEVTGEELLRWQRWIDDLPKLERLSVNRCFKPDKFGNISSCQIHNFADASEQGYGVAVYVRLVNDKNQIHCSLLMGKSRVVPLKKTTIPRIELTAATLAVRLYNKIQKWLDYKVEQVYYWTDSMAVLRFISSEASRFHTFVANRVTVIREGSDKEQWNYVDSKANPADAASRGLGMKDMSKAEQWIDGPAFLGQPSSEWPRNPDNMEQVKIDDPEIRHKVLATEVQIDSNTSVSFFDLVLSKFSSAMKLRKVVGWILVYLKNLRDRCSKRRSGEDLKTLTPLAAVSDQIKDVYLQNDMLQEAELAIVKYVQQQHFAEELRTIQKNQDCVTSMKKSSPLYKLEPILVDGVLRIGGRLRSANIDYDAKHQIILPKDTPLSVLILQETHKAVGHFGRNMMLAKLRQRYWIIGANQLIKKVLAKCVLCRKYRAQTGQQKMADLPQDRIDPGELPFTEVGVDYFGPIEVTRGRSVVKRYGVLFTCLKIRAVHLEVAYTLDTDSCINAIRRFLARRGSVKLMRSDNGTNLVGAEREMRDEISKWNESCFNEALRQRGITWKFNPPGGSHFGGVWERLIRSVRKIYMLF